VERGVEVNVLEIWGWAFGALGCIVYVYWAGLAGLSHLRAYSEFEAILLPRFLLLGFLACATFKGHGSDSGRAGGRKT
jgi:hypothetical protein